MHFLDAAQEIISNYSKAMRSGDTTLAWRAVQDEMAIMSNGEGHSFHILEKNDEGADEWRPAYANRQYYEMDWEVVDG